MQVPPHMREAGGVLPTSTPTFPSHAHRGQQVCDRSWAADVGQQMWGSRCGAAVVGRSPSSRGQARLLGQPPRRS
jgi:hypothetical protein